METDKTTKYAFLQFYNIIDAAIKPIRQYNCLQRHWSRSWAKHERRKRIYFEIKHKTTKNVFKSQVRFWISIPNIAKLPTSNWVSEKFSGKCLRIKKYSIKDGNEIYWDHAEVSEVTKRRKNLYSDERRKTVVFDDH